MADARRKLALWRYDYNNVRPHSSLANKTPAEARRALELMDSNGPGALATPEPALADALSVRVCRKHVWGIGLATPDIHLALLTGLKSQQLL